VLEGGYNTTGGGQCSPLAKSIEAHMEALVKDLGQTFDTGLIEKEKRTYAEMI